MHIRRRLLLCTALALAGTLLPADAARAGAFTVNFFLPGGAPITGSVSYIIKDANNVTVLSGSTTSGQTLTVPNTKLSADTDKSLTMWFTSGGTTTFTGILGTAPVTQVLNVTIPPAGFVQGRRHHGPALRFREVQAGCGCQGYGQGFPGGGYGGGWYGGSGFGGGWGGFGGGFGFGFGGFGGFGGGW